MITHHDHWNRIYETKSPSEFSWWQSRPQTSLDFLESFKLEADAPIIDIGGGDSLFVDYLLDQGYTDISILDISEKALERARTRLAERADRITWICSDILTFDPIRRYVLWHDRATFHFLNTASEITCYMRTASQAVTKYLNIGTFSDKGPTMCSGLQVHRYTESQLEFEVRQYFDKIRCVTEDHVTPFQTVQNFLICGFSRKVGQ